MCEDNMREKYIKNLNKEYTRKQAGSQPVF